MRTSLAAPRCAWLRVYEPLSAFAEPERSQWAAYAAGEHPDPPELVRAERRASLARATALPVLVAPEVESRDAFILLVEDRVMVCPRDERTRCLAALDALLDELPEPLLSAFLPPSVRGREPVVDIRIPDRMPRLLTATWNVPIGWFAVFAEKEQLLLQDADGQHSLVYRTDMSHARRRAARALQVLRRSVDSGPVTQSVESVARWLEEFHPRSVVELDYGGLLPLLGEGELVPDPSVADVSEGLAALGNGRPDEAATAYARLARRWREVQELEHAN